MQYPKYVAEVIERLEKNGFEAYIVGGSVRDTLMNRAPNDYDVATSALPDEILNIFDDMKTIPTGIKHGTVTVISEGNPIEITTFRIDGEYKDSRRPESVSFTARIEEDLSRRDFTVNAMAYSKKRGLVDPFSGKEDISKRTIRAVGDPEKRFSEDALRIMRAFRFSAQLGFDIDSDTLSAAAVSRDELSQIARERISAEFLKLISSEYAETTLKIMRNAGFMSFVFKEYLPSNELISAACANAPCSERIRLALLLSQATDEQKESILGDLRLSTKLSSNILSISKKCASHLCGDDASARRFIGGCGELLDDVLSAAAALGNLDKEFEKRIRDNLAKKICTKTSELEVNGSDLVRLGISGHAVGETLGKLLDRVLADPSVNNKKILLQIAAELNNIEKE